MNFYAHCHLARLDGADAAFALGSMLPDFAGMSGARLVRVDHQEVALGVQHHHVVDGVFHAAPTFVRLCQESSVRLDAAGVRWGTGRAVAHIGVELLLDGYLLDDGQADALYLRALDGGDDAAGHLHWSVAEADARFRRLCRRLHELGANPDHGSPEVVSDRLHRALAPRPRLAIEDRDSSAVRAEMDRLHDDVRRAAPTLMSEVHEGLEAHPKRPFGVDLRRGIGDDSCSLRENGSGSPSRSES
ncbi:MAG: hypothetical protein H6723_00075 [Sandaracinus sp.]|nr:hypothetical protein [Sandaracinus sp.]